MSNSTHIRIEDADRYAGYTVTTTREDHGVLITAEDWKGITEARVYDGVGIDTLVYNDDYTVTITLHDGRTFTTAYPIAEGLEQAETAALNAQNSALAAAGSAVDAANSATDAETSAEVAEDSADAAATSATAASGSATSAASSATAAAGSATAAANSATAAASSASTASTKATAADTSATAAASSASSASTSATNASNSATAAAGSATSASNYASAASSSATAASGSATSASNYATTATNKASEASGYATAAATKAGEAAASAAAAAESARTLTIDTTLTQSGQAAEAKATGDALSTKAEIDGYYENLTAGTANQLNSVVRANDQKPYTYRTSGGSIDIGDREYINAIVGGTVAWNQLAQTLDQGVDNVWCARSYDSSTGVTTFTPSNYSKTSIGFYTYANNLKSINGHVYLETIDINPDHNGSFQFGFENGGSVTKSLNANSYQTIATVKKPSQPSLLVLYLRNNDWSDGVFKVKNYNVFDLTQMFGSTIAEYILALETATAGAGVAWFKKLFPQPYFAYDAGTLKSVEGLISHDMTGFNQFDKDAVTANTWLSDVDGTTAAQSGYNVSDFIPILPNTTYYKSGNGSGRNLYYDANKVALPNQSWNSIASGPYAFTTPVNAYYMRFTITDGTLDSFILNLAWDNSRNGEYEPYIKHSYPLDSTLTLRGIPKLDASNSLYYDGDTYESDGTVTRQCGIVDLGELDYYRGGDDNKCFCTNGLRRGLAVYPEIKPSEWNSVQSYLLVSNGYELTSGSNAYLRQERSIGVDGNGQIYIYDSEKVSMTNSEFKSAMSGVYLVYELNSPSTESADPYTNPQIVNDFGTEGYTFDSEVAVCIPVGSNTDYPIDMRAKLEMLPNSPDGDGDYIVRQTNGENSYVPLIIEDVLPVIPSEAGTYKLIVTVADGVDPVLSWEAE